MKKQTKRRGLFFLLFLLCTVLTSVAQNVPVTGKVTDEAGKALEGATVEEKGTRNKAITDKAGVFKLNVTSATGTLVVSFVGHEQMELPLNNQKEVTVSLKTTAESLTDVVVIGYATVKKKDVTGSVAGINQKDI
ncbi:MAG TPA: carboxypeptidase-like regulatory domain-containing protein, partial [Chitinophagaceae bacterium]|nr:carboxypeptidase-like regulatory domain-containing protein [Chitinophagaceae bacterium]